MAGLVFFACLFLAANYVSGTLGLVPDEDGWHPRRPHVLYPWDRDLLRHGIDPKWYYLRRHRYDYNKVRYDPAAGWVSSEATSTANTEKRESVKARRKNFSTVTQPWIFRNYTADYTRSKNNHVDGHPQGLRHPAFKSRLETDHTSAVIPDVDKRTVVMAKTSRVQLLKAKAAENQLGVNDLERKSTGEKGEMTETIHVEENSTSIGSNEEAGHSESGVEANEKGRLEEEVKSEATDTSAAEEIGTTEAVPESSGVEETTTPSVPDEVDSAGDEKNSESSFPDTTVSVKETTVTVHSTVDHSSSKEISPSNTPLSSSVDTASETVSSTPSTATERSPEGILPSKAPLPSSAVTASETMSSTPSTATERSSERISPSNTPLPSSVVTASETVPSISSAGDKSSKIVSPSKTPLPPSTVTVSETVSSTPSKEDDRSSKGGESTSSTIPVTEHVIVLPRIRSARIVLSSVLLAIGLVAVAVAAVCIFRERRRKIKYDQLKLLP